MSTRRKSQSGDIIQVNIHKLKMLQVIVDEMITSAESIESDPGTSKRKGHPFHGKPTKARPIAMISPVTGIVVKEFSSINQAAQTTRISNSSIWQSCNTGKVRCKYRWEYVDINEDIAND